MILRRPEMSPHMAKGGIERLRRNGMPSGHAVSAMDRPLLCGFGYPVLQRRFHFLPDGGEGFGAVCLETGDQHGLRVGCADKSPAVSEVHPRTVEFDGIVEIAEMFLDPVPLRRT